MKKIALSIFSLMLLGAMFVSGGFALAQQSSDSQQEALNQLKTAGNASGVNTNGVGSKDPRIFVATTIKTALGFIGIIFLVMTVYAGFLWMTAGGEDDKIETARKLISNGVIGLAIVLSAYSITYFIIRWLVGSTGIQA